MALAFRRIHHVAIICSDYERSKRFYVSVLGGAVVSETYRSERRSFKLDIEYGGGARIELFSFPGPPSRVSRPEACGLRHLAFEVDDVEASKRALEKMGVDVEGVRIDELTGMRYTFFSDPDGLPIELYERRREDDAGSGVMPGH